MFIQTRWWSTNTFFSISNGICINLEVLLWKPNSFKKNLKSISGLPPSAEDDCLASLTLPVCIKYRWNEYDNNLILRIHLFFRLFSGAGSKIFQENLLLKFSFKCFASLESLEVFSCSSHHGSALRLVWLPAMLNIY